MPTQQKYERNNKLIEMREKGVSYTKLAEEFGITKQRVHQILLKYRPELCYRGENVRDEQKRA